MGTTIRTKDGTGSASSESSACAAFLRIFWMFIGTAALGIGIVMILQNRQGLFGLGDIVCALSLPLSILARYLDIAYFSGFTATLEPATMAHWRRYTVWLLILTIIAWAVAHGIAYAMI